MTPERKVPADEIRARLASDRGLVGFVIESATIEGALDLSATNLSSLAFIGCRFEAELVLRGASLESLFLGGCSLPGIDAREAHLLSDLQLCEGTHVEGAVRLEGARIGGNLSCNGAILAPAAVASGQRPAGGVLLGRDAAIGGHVLMANGFRAAGEVDLSQARVGGMLYCAHADFENRHGIALNLEGAEIAGSTILSHGFKVRGEVVLRTARLNGVLYCAHGSFENPGGDALDADGVRIGGRAFLSEWFSAKGAVRLRDAQIAGDLHCVGGLFQNPGGDALDAERIAVGGAVRMHTRFLAQGRVCLDAGRITGSVKCGGGRFENRGAVALSGTGLTVGHDLILGSGFRADGVVRLDRARIGGALDADDAVCDELSIEGMRTGSSADER